MSDLLKRILKRQTSNYPAIIYADEFDQTSKEFKYLVSLGILVPGEIPKQKLCPTCQNEYLTYKIVKKDLAYTICSTDGTAGRDRFDPRDLINWQLDTTRLLSLVVSNLDHQTPVVESVKGELWSMGSMERQSKRYHLFFTRSLNALTPRIQSVFGQMPNPVLFYAGDLRDKVLDGVLLIPIEEAVTGVAKDKVTTNREALLSYLPDDLKVAEQGDVVLDKDIALSEDDFLKLKRDRGSTYKSEEKVLPLAGRIIRYMHQVRHNDANTRKAKDLADALDSTPRSILNQIKIVNDLCETYKVKPIFHPTKRGVWVLNPKLGCYKVH